MPKCSLPLRHRLEAPQPHDRSIGGYARFPKKWVHDGRLLPLSGSDIQLITLVLWQNQRQKPIRKKPRNVEYASWWRCLVALHWGDRQVDYARLKTSLDTLTKHGFLKTWEEGSRLVIMIHKGLFEDSALSSDITYVPIWPKKTFRLNNAIDIRLNILFDIWKAPDLSMNLNITAEKIGIKARWPGERKARIRKALANITTVTGYRTGFTKAKFVAAYRNKKMQISKSKWVNDVGKKTKAPRKMSVHERRLRG